MKINRNNILLILFLILIFIFSICILSKNILIENYDSNNSYGLENCKPENSKILNINTDSSTINLAKQCIGEYKSYSNNPNNCSKQYILSNKNEDMCSGGEYTLGFH